MFEPKGLFASSPYKGQINTDCALGPYGWTIEATTNKLDHYNLTLTQKDGMKGFQSREIGTNVRRFAAGRGTVGTRRI